MAKGGLKQFEEWHKSRPGLAIFGVLELLLSYVAVSRAIDTGSYWQYLLAVILLIGGAQNIIKLIGSLIHGNKPGNKKVRSK